MDSRVEHYREKAREVRRLAELTTGPDIRAEFLHIAAQYERMADRLDYQKTHREIRFPAERAGEADPSGSGAEDAR